MARGFRGSKIAYFFFGPNALCGGTTTNVYGTIAQCYGITALCYEITANIYGITEYVDETTVLFMEKEVLVKKLPLRGGITLRICTQTFLWECSNNRL